MVSCLRFLSGIAFMAIVGCGYSSGLCGPGGECPQGQECVENQCMQILVYDTDDDCDQSRPFCDVVSKSCVTCSPDCTGKCCGDDGCGSVCQNHCGTTGQTCNPDTCLCEGECVPYCDDRECGPDGCRGECAPGCGEGYACNAEGRCEGACMDGETRCGGECVNINSDPRHCGGCQKACGDGEICTDSNCGKAPDCREIPCTGFTYCDLGTGKCKPGCDADDQCGPRQSCDVTTHSCVDAAVNNLLLVVDKSGSMMDASQEGGSQSKLEDARQALHLMLDEGEGKIRFGWMQFPHGSFCEPGVVSVDCGDDSVPEIRDRVNALLAEGGTPTGESLQKADTYRGLHDPHRCNFVLLLTDGLPTCPNGEGVGNNQADNQMALEAVQALHSQRIDTFVIGLGEDLNASNPEILNQMADAGGRARGGDVKYYQANNLDELQTTVQTIAVAVIGCNMR